MSSDGRACSGIELVRNAMIGRCMADVIPCIGAPGGFLAWGEDVRSWVGSPFTDSLVQQRQQRLAVIFGRDDRVDRGTLSVRVGVTLAGPSYDFGIAVDFMLAGTGERGSFVAGVTADKVTVESLAGQGSGS